MTTKYLIRTSSKLLIYDDYRKAKKDFIYFYSGICDGKIFHCNVEQYDGEIDLTPKLLVVSDWVKLIQKRRLEEF